MAKFRYKDHQEKTEHGQVLGYANWMGGPTLTYVGGVICEDGIKRNFFVTGENTTYWTTPGYVHINKNRIQGHVTCNDGIYYFTKFTKRSSSSK